MADYRDNTFPEDDATRRRFPMADGLLDYFPAALAYVAEVSKIGSEKHNVGEEMHHARGKSTDHRNKIMRHLVDAGGKDASGVRHSAYLAWRALALLQEELEREEEFPLARGARPAECPVKAATMPGVRDPVPGVYDHYLNAARAAIATAPSEFDAGVYHNRYLDLLSVTRRAPLTDENINKAWGAALKEVATFAGGTCNWRKNNG